MYDISPEELKDYKAYTIVDIRDSMSYAYGHLPDAISVPQAELSTYIDEWKDAGKILIYCKRGEASLDAVLMLREQGVEAYNLDGGYMAWLMLAMQEPADQPDTDFAKDVEESIRKRFRKKIWCRFTKAINEYELVKPGDNIAVCISGGKDSMLMAKLFQELKRHNKFPFGVQFLVMDPGYSPENRQVIETNAKNLNIPITIFESDIFESVFHVEKSPCYLCARMRRGHLYKNARALGCNKIALGHHFDDVIETTLMSMLWGAEVKTMMPKLHSTNYPGMELIRPLYLVRETDILAWKRYNGLTFLKCACRFTEQEADEGMHGARSETKALIAALRKTNPQADVNIFRSMHHVNLNMALGWTQDGQLRSFLDGYETQRTAAGGGPENE